MSNAGAQAEQLAAQFLQQQGLTLLHKNFRCRFGEIDLIMQEGETHVLVEVRLRSSAQFGGPAASIDARKQAKLLKTAQFYLAQFKSIPPCRFDAILLQSPDIHKIEWLKNAFSA